MHAEPQFSIVSALVEKHLALITGRPKFTLHTHSFHLFS